MKRLSGSLLSTFVKYRATAALLALAALPVALRGAGPAWWGQRGVIAVDGSGVPLPADDFAIANQGQLKQMATQAYAEFQQRLSIISGGIGSMQGPDGTGFRLSTLISGFSVQSGGSSAGPDDFAAVNLGQLKTVAQPFYDRLIELHIVSAYPWAPFQQSVDDYAAANIGQVKNLFNFDFTISTETDGIPDWWKRVYGLSTTDPTVAGAISSAGGLTNLQEYQLNLNPNSADSDGDGVPDVVELANGTNPLVPDNPLLMLQVSGFTSP